MFEIKEKVGYLSFITLELYKWRKELPTVANPGLEQDYDKARDDIILEFKRLEDELAKCSHKSD